MELLLESRQTFDVASVPTSGLVDLVFSRQTVSFFEFEHPFMVKPIVIAEPAEASAPLKAWVRNYNLETYRACFLDSCRIVHKYKYTKIKQSKERLCWQDDS